MRSTFHRWFIFLALALGGASASGVMAQQTIFNVPSPDVLDAGMLYFETDHYIGSTRTEGERPGFFSVRGVTGMGASTEVGFNLGPFDHDHPSQPFIDVAFKWRPLQRPLGKTDGTLGLFLGDNAGQGFRNDVSGRFRNFAYAAGFFELPGKKTRFSAGPYFATRSVFTEERRFGAQVTVEQTIPGLEGWKIAADWFSGDGAFATAGLIWTTGRSTFYAGYGLANQRSGTDFVTLEYGILL